MLAIYLSMLETNEEKNQFEQLYIKYKQDMYAVAYGILKNKEDAEDAVHQSFLKIADYNVPLVKTQMKKIIVTAKTLYSHPKNVSKIYAALHTDLAW